MNRRRGSVMYESALVMLVYVAMMAGIMELGLVGFAVNAVSFAAHRAARYAAVRGSSTGSPATAAQITTSAKGYAAPLSAAGLTVAASWSPNNNPGSTVQVKVSYNFAPTFLPVDTKVLTIQTTACEIIAQ